MIANRFVKECKVLAAQMDDASTEGVNEFCGPFPVTRIAPIVFPTAVVQKGKKLDDQRIRPRLFGDAQAVLTNPLPMRNSMNAVKVQHEPLLGSPDDLLEFSL